jgi:hypothetical protein
MKKTKKMPEPKTTEVVMFDGPGNRIATVNVIELAEGEVCGIASFPDTEEGSRNAEIRFHDVIKENVDDELEEVIETAIEDGHYEKDTYSVCLTHSS